MRGRGCIGPLGMGPRGPDTTNNKDGDEGARVHRPVRDGASWSRHYKQKRVAAE